MGRKLAVIVNTSVEVCMEVCMGETARETGQDRQELSLEEAFGQIEDVIAHLETEEITLEESFREYNRGMQLLRHCSDAIDRVEKKVLQINESGGLDEF